MKSILSLLTNNGAVEIVLLDAELIATKIIQVVKGRFNESIFKYTNNKHYYSAQN